MSDEAGLHSRIVGLCRDVENTYGELVGTVDEVARALAAGRPIVMPDGFDDAHFQWCIERKLYDGAARVSPQAMEPKLRYLAARQALYPTMEQALERLRSGDGSMLEWAISYLEADPWDFHSGYFKQELMRALRRVSLWETDRDRLRRAILGTLPKGRRHEQKEVRSLARRLDSAAFREELATIAEEHPDEGTRERAKMTLAACRLNDAHHDLRGAVNRSDSST